MGGVSHHHHAHPGARAVQIFFLALVLTQDLTGAATAKLAVMGGNASASDLTDPLVDGDIEKHKFGDHRYDGKNAKSAMANTIWVSLTLANIYLFKDDLLALGQMKECKFADIGDPEHFDALGKVHSNINPVTIEESSAVILDIQKCSMCLDTDGNPVAGDPEQERVFVRPYDKTTARGNGIIAYMVHNAGEYTQNEETYNMIEPGDLLVSLDCEQFDEANPKMKQALQEHVPIQDMIHQTLDDYVTNKALSLLTRKVTRSVIFYKPKAKYMYCPAGDALELKAATPEDHCWRPARLPQDDGGDDGGDGDDDSASEGDTQELEEEEDDERRSGRKARARMKKKKSSKKRKRSHRADDTSDHGTAGDYDEKDIPLAVKQFLRDLSDSHDDPKINYSDEEVTGGREHGRSMLPIRLHKGYMGNTLTALLLFFIYIVVTWYFSRFLVETELGGDQNALKGVLFHIRFLTDDADSYEKILIYIISGLLMIGGTVVAMWGTGKVIAASSGVKVAQRSRLSRIYIHAACSMIIAFISMFVVARIYVESSDLNSMYSVTFNSMVASVQWFNTYMSLLFFADVAIKYFHEWLQFPVAGMFDEKSSDVILGITGALGEVLGMMDTIRAHHVWNSGCELAELGYTFRQIVANAPESFPKGSKLTLQCTESTLSFEQVFNLTWANESNNGQRNPKFDDGNMCILSCALTDADGKENTRATPIWCKDSGLFNARWTLSSHREAQQGDLCPKPADSSAAALSSSTLIQKAAVALGHVSESEKDEEVRLLRQTVAADEAQISELTNEMKDVRALLAGRNTQRS